MTETTMTALAVTQLSTKAQLIDVPRPQAEPGTVVIKTLYSGVSIGTEMWIATGARSDYGDPPFINGYQATGEVVQVGDEVTDFAPGDLVVVFCRGAHAPYVKASAALTHRLDDVAHAKACALFVGPCVGANAINQAQVNTGDTVLVVGQGLIGQSTAQLLKLRGAYVITSDISADRLAVSRKHCAHWAIDANDGALSAQLKERFEWGVDVVFESTGFNHLIEDAMNCVNGQGRFVFEGWYPGKVDYTFAVPHGKQLRAFYPAFIGDPPVREGVIRLIESGALEIEPMISHLVSWRDSEAVYKKFFTPERNAFNAVVFDWTDA